MNMESTKQNADLILALGMLAGWVMTAAVLMVRAWRNGWARRAQARRDSESAELAAEKERFAEQHKALTQALSERDAARAERDKERSLASLMTRACAREETAAKELRTSKSVLRRRLKAVIGEAHAWKRVAIAHGWKRPSKIAEGQTSDPALATKEIAG